MTALANIFPITPIYVHKIFFVGKLAEYLFSTVLILAKEKKSYIVSGTT